MMLGLLFKYRSVLKLVAAVLVGFLSLQIIPLFAVTDVLREIGDEVNAIFEKARPAVVKIRATGSGGEMVNSGTGFFISGDGTLVSTSAVIGPDNAAIVTYDGKDFNAKVIGSDNHTGMSLLKIVEDNTPFLTLGTSNDLKTADPLICIGFPLNLPVAPSYGLVSGEDIRYLDKFFPTTHIHANITASPGEPGAPVLKPDGTVAGVYVNNLDQGRSIYILPSEAMQKVIGDFKLFGRLRRGWVGIIVDEYPNAPDSRTVNVRACAEGSPAFDSGIMPGDTVMRIDSREIYRPSDLMDASFFSHPGDSIDVIVRRDDQMIKYTLTLIERPESAIVPQSLPADATSDQVRRN